MNNNCGINYSNKFYQINQQENFESYDKNASPNEKWRLGGYSSSKSGLSNSDDKKMSDWSRKLL